MKIPFIELNFVYSGLMSYPRPTIVSRYDVIGETTNRHGVSSELVVPVYSAKRKSFRDYLSSPKRPGDRYWFPHGTFHKIISQHLRPCEGKSHYSYISLSFDS